MTWLAKVFRRNIPPRLENIKQTNGKTAILLVHGFTANAQLAFGSLPDILCNDVRFAGYDLFRLQYDSNLRLDFPIASREPDITLLGAQLATQLLIEPLAAYRSILLIGHSMGGLVIQAAMLAEISPQNISHILFLGTPSAGLPGISLLRPFKRQLRDMSATGPFITNLRDKWSQRYKLNAPFAIAAVAGASDEIVEPASSLEPFAAESRMVIPGTHGSIALVESPEHPLLAVLVRLLSGQRLADQTTDLARIALEEHDYRRVIALLSNAPEKLDAAALSDLALAFDALRQTDTALTVLESIRRPHTDLMGILAGRYKRKWLAGRDASNLERAKELYGDALQQAKFNNDLAQISYHAINLAFLELISSTNNSLEPSKVRDLAGLARSAAEKIPNNYWSVVTRAEADLLLGDYDAAMETFKSPIIKTASLRERESTNLNASMILAKRGRLAEQEELGKLLIGLHY
jgi:pimeloyl-ACP methyl ester carboxylesterase